MILRDLETQLGEALAELARWEGATGLHLKPSKCVVVRLAGSREQYRDIRDRCAESRTMRLADSGLYLGVQVGPAA